MDEQMDTQTNRGRDGQKDVWIYIEGEINEIYRYIEILKERRVSRGRDELLEGEMNYQTDISVYGGGGGDRYITMTRHIYECISIITHIRGRDGQTDVWIYRWRDGYIDIQEYRHMEGERNRQIYRYFEGEMDRQIYGYIEGDMDRQMYGYIEGEMD